MGHCFAAFSKYVWPAGAPFSRALSELWMQERHERTTGPVIWLSRNIVFASMNEYVTAQVSTRAYAAMV